MADRRDGRVGDSPQLRIAISGPRLEGTVGGIAEHVRLLLTWLNDTGSTQAVAVETAGKSYGESWLSKIAGVPSRMRGVWRAARWADVVHVNSTIDRRSLLRDLVMTMTARMAGARVVVQFHGGGRSRLGALGEPWALTVLRPLLAGASTALFLTSEQAEELETLVRGVPVFVVSNAVAIPPCSDRRAVDALPVVLYLGRLDRDKGVVELIEAVTALHPGSCSLVVAGAGELETWVSEAAQTHEEIDFRGAVFGDEKGRALCDADVFVLASSHNEGMPYAILEAGAAGCALIATARGRITSVVQDGVNGVVLPDASKEAVQAALASVLSDPDRMHEMGRESRRIVRENFDIETLGRRLVSLYEDVASGEVSQAWPAS